MRLISGVTIDPTEENGLRVRSQMMADKPVTVRRERIGRQVGHLDDKDISRWNMALAFVMAWQTNNLGAIYDRLISNCQERALGGNGRSPPTPRCPRAERLASAPAYNACRPNRSA